MTNHWRQTRDGMQSRETTLDRVYGPVELSLSVMPFVRLNAGFQSSEKIGGFLGVAVDWDIHSRLEGLGNIYVHQDDYLYCDPARFGVFYS